jgi:Amt family ammonium transporter
MLTSSALVLMMTPGGLAIFYGGLTRQKNAVNTLHMVFITTGIIAIQFVLFGYSLAFGPDAGGFGFIGTLDWAGLNNVLHDVPSNAYGGIDGYTIPHQTYMIFQMMFAIITPALIVAALAERMKFSAFVIFIILWSTFVYDFAAHWTWEITAADNYWHDTRILRFRLDWMLWFSRFCRGDCNSYHFWLGRPHSGPNVR